jgi:hypothetical protein
MQHLPLNDLSNATQKPQKQRSTRNTRLTERKREADAGCKITTTPFTLSYAHHDEPSSIEEALALPCTEKWLDASLIEINSLNKTAQMTLTH